MRQHILSVAVAARWLFFCWSARETFAYLPPYAEPPQWRRHDRHYRQRPLSSLSASRIHSKYRMRRTPQQEEDIMEEEEYEEDENDESISSDHGFGTTKTNDNRYNMQVLVDEETVLRRQRAEHRLLLVDDEPDILDAVGSFLRSSGYHVSTCPDGVQAWNWLDQQFRSQQQQQQLPSSSSSSSFLPSAIVSDVRMPHMDGIEFLSRLRQDGRMAAWPVVLLTAKGQTQDRITGYNAGADAYIPKPFDPQELVTVLDSLIQKRKVLQPPSPEVTVQELQRDMQELKHLLLEQGGGGTAVQGFVQDTNVFFAPDEQEVLEYLCQGLMNKEIAQRTYLSQRRVEQLLTLMFRKVNVKNRTELVRWAIATGHVQLD